MDRQLPLGARLHNPGNIERVAGVIWQGQHETQPHPRFVRFTAPEWGIRAICRVLITYQDKRQAADGSAIDTVREIVERWAPPGENDTDAYVASAAQRLAQVVDPTAGDLVAGQQIDVTDYATMRGMVEAIIHHENGFVPYDEATIVKGIVLAGIEPPDRTVYEVLKPAPRPLAKSGTMQMGATAVIGAGGMMAITVFDRFMGFVEKSNGWQLVFAGVVVVAVAGVMWRYVDDRRKGLRDVDVDRLADRPL